MKFWKSIALVISIGPLGASGSCDFKTAEYSSVLNDPSEIVEVKIEIPESGKFARNQFKIFTSSSANIEKKLKRKFSANLAVKYREGTCKYRAKVRQSGDWKDHIALIDGRPIQSLDVALKEGNVLGATKFKLLIPETRLGKNEVLGSLILKKLNFISPETFEVSVSVNGVTSLMLFQEKASKELLESNKRREGPIFEGDESLLWSYGSYSNFELEPLSLARLVNVNWFEKGAVSQAIVLNAFASLQNVYLRYAQGNALRSNNFFLNLSEYAGPANQDYEVLLLAMGAKHALRPHNRKYYYNSMTQKFEPIYYDGNIEFSVLKPSQGLGTDEIISLGFSDALLQNIMIMKASDELYLDFQKRIKSESNSKFVEDSLNRIISNLRLARNYVSTSPPDRVNGSRQADKWYVDFQDEKGLKQEIVRKITLHGDRAVLKMSRGGGKVVTMESVADLISKAKLLDNRATYIPNNNKEIISHEFELKKIGNSLIKYSAGVRIVIDEATRTINMHQADPRDWVLVQGGSLKGWLINFFGKEGGEVQGATEQRFNTAGLTGCLTLHKIELEETTLSIEGGACEDSLNFVQVTASDVNLNITSAFSDAFDADFSSVSIKDIEVTGAGNDCLDVSAGDYFAANVELSGCSDKAISVGEGSTFGAAQVRVHESNLGISAKDLSRASIDVFNATNVKVCGEARRKKQEFGGGALFIRNSDCAGPFHHDDESNVVVQIK